MKVPEADRKSSTPENSNQDTVHEKIRENPVLAKGLLFLIVSIVLLILLWQVNSRFQNGVTLFETAVSALLSLLLVLLYWQSLSVTQTQSEIMEKHQELMEIDHRPYLRPIDLEVVEKDGKEVLKIELQNEGKGLASTLYASCQLDFSALESGKLYKTPETKALLEPLPPFEEQRFTEGMRGGFLNRDESGIFGTQPTILWEEGDSTEGISVQEALHRAKIGAKYHNLEQVHLKIAVACKDRFDNIHLQYLYGTTAELSSCEYVEDILENNRTTTLSSERLLAQELEDQWFKMEMLNPTH